MSTPPTTDRKPSKKADKKKSPSRHSEVKISEADSASLPVSVEAINAKMAELLFELRGLHHASQKLTKSPIQSIEEHDLQTNDLRLEYLVRLIGCEGEIFRISGPAVFNAMLDPEILPEAVHSFQHIVQAHIFRPMMARFNTHLNKNIVRRPDTALLSDSTDQPFNTPTPVAVPALVIDDTATRPPQPGGSSPGDPATPS